jgi:hypothetical protein
MSIEIFDSFVETFFFPDLNIIESNSMHTQKQFISSIIFESTLDARMLSEKIQANVITSFSTSVIIENINSQLHFFFHAIINRKSWSGTIIYNFKDKTSWILILFFDA